MRPIEVLDEVLVFGKYEGTILEHRGDQVMVYCPDFDAASPFLVTDIANVILIQNSVKKLVN
jgi:hypothetical protein